MIGIWRVLIFFYFEALVILFFMLGNFIFDHNKLLNVKEFSFKCCKNGVIVSQVNSFI